MEYIYVYVCMFTIIQHNNSLSSKLEYNLHIGSKLGVGGNTAL